MPTPPFLIGYSDRRPTPPHSVHSYILLISPSTANHAYLQTAVINRSERITAAEQACTLAASLSGSLPYASPQINDAQYINDIAHWSNASSLVATCTVEPQTVQDVQSLMSIINSTRTPWAVKGIGHCNNRNMSSTVGLQIAMTSFNTVQVDTASQTVKLGPGANWGQVWEAVSPLGLNVVGGRSGEVGTGGLLLSGGYSWKTNEHGLAVDNIVAWDLVTPTGDFVQVTQDSEPDLFFALQGGVNNFGIVTSMTLKTHEQGEVWGGVVSVTGDLTKAIEAISKYANTTTDPKAVVATLFGATAGATPGQTSATFILFYDAPEPPTSLFDDFLALPGATLDIATRSFIDFTSTFDIAAAPNNRATWHSAPVLHWPQELVEFIVQQIISFANTVSSRSGTAVSGNVEPFLPAAYSFNRGAAINHSPATPYNTFNGLIQWSDPADDEFMFNATREYHESVWQKAIELGVSQASATLYPNYAIQGTPVEQIYGDNLPRLREIKKKIDPYNVIGLTGGWSI